MDLQQILDQKIRALPVGPHSNGLRAVRSHIEAAVRHLVRGQTDSDDSLFTDVIFRCNQAFEGSIKEAYRILAGKNPQKTTTAEIEQFLASGDLLRAKVLAQFTNYRQEWRNPSTHDHTLDFDEDEALIAVVSVTVFAIVLCDQIDSKLAFDAAARMPTSGVSGVEQGQPLLELVASKALSFASTHTDTAPPGMPSARPLGSHDYFRVEGAFAGYLSAQLANIPEINVIQQATLSMARPDVLIEKDREKVIIELKLTSSRGAAPQRHFVQRAVEKLAVYLGEAGVVGGIVLVYSGPDTNYAITPATGVLSDSVRIVAPCAELVA